MPEDLQKPRPSKIPIMKAMNSNEDRLANFAFPAFSQMKADGMRCQLEVTPNTSHPLSSIGRVYRGLSEFLKRDMDIIRSRCEWKEFILDGELLAHDVNGDPLPRAKSNGITNKLGHGTIDRHEMASLRFIVWDIIPASRFWSGAHGHRYTHRLKTVKELVEGCTKIWAIPTVEVADIEEAKTHAKQLIEEGYEGTILKEMDAEWINKRSKHCLKFKEENDCDLEVVEIQEGAGKYDGMMGALVCESSDKSVRVKIGTGFTDSMRNEYFDPQNILGKIVKVKYNTKTEAQDGVHSLFLPVFGGVRSDKVNADTLNEIA